MRRLPHLRQRVSLWLHRLANWIWTPPPRTVENPVLARALVLVESVHQCADPAASGEYKRHTVYARLLKEFPDTRRRDVSLLLEAAVQQVLD